MLFHPEGEEYLKRTVLRGLDYCVFDPAKDIRYDIAGLFRAAGSCLRRDSRTLVRSFGSVRYLKIFLRKVRARLVAYQIRQMKPKVVLTFIDNSNIFHMTCEACEEIPFLAIQNGGRHIWCATEALPDPELKYHIDEYFCFGPYVRDLFEKHGHDIRKYIFCGSLFGGEAFSTYMTLGTEAEKKFDLCLVSQWKRDLLHPESLPSRWVRLIEAINIVADYVARYASENHVSVYIPLRTNDPAERSFYHKQFRGKCVFEDSNRLAYSSYAAVAASRLTIAINSTLLTEAFGAGLKVLFVNPFGEEWLRPTGNTGIWCLSKPDYGQFSERVDALLHMDIREYLSEAGAEMKRSMSYNLVQPAHKVIRDRIMELIASSN